MKIAVASGKGGTGKTTVALALAHAAEGGARLLDCDVEEPNCHLFVRPKREEVLPVTLRAPVIDQERCRLCGKCAEACEFSALAAMPTKVLTFPDLCHGCGACSFVCPSGAITETPIEIGEVRIGSAGDLRLVYGCLHVGKAQAPPVIREVMRHASRRATTIIDAPPGSSCPMVAATRRADFILLVTELTPFGLHDLGLAIDTIEPMGIPMGIVINRVPEGYTDDLALDDRAPVLLRIPESRKIAETYARGGTLLDAMPEMRPQFEELLRLATAGEASRC